MSKRVGVPSEPWVPFSASLVRKQRERLAKNVAAPGLPHFARFQWARMLQAYDDIVELAQSEVGAIEPYYVNKCFYDAWEAGRHEADVKNSEIDVAVDAELDELGQLLITLWWRRFDGMAPADVVDVLTKFLGRREYNPHEENLRFRLVCGNGRDRTAFVTLVEEFVSPHAAALRAFVAALINSTRPSYEVDGTSEPEWAEALVAAFRAPQAVARGRKAFKAVMAAKP